jgi:hypothetical protein
MITPEIISLALAGVTAIVWLVRLEGRVNTTDKEVATLRAKADSDAKSSSETAIEIVRLQEQIKHLTDLIERMAGPPEPTRRRAAS